MVITIGRLGINRMGGEGIRFRSGKEANTNSIYDYSNRSKTIRYTMIQYVRYRLASAGSFPSPAFISTVRSIDSNTG